MSTMAGFLVLHQVFSEDISDYENVVRNYAEKMDIALPELFHRLDQLPENVDPVAIQTVFYDVGKEYFGTEKEELRKFFEVLYMIFCQARTGPRWGNLAAIMGLRFFTDIFRLNYGNLFMIAMRSQKIHTKIEEPTMPTVKDRIENMDTTLDQTRVNRALKVYDDLYNNTSGIDCDNYKILREFVLREVIKSFLVGDVPND